MKKEKQAPLLQKLFNFSGNYKYLTISGMVLSGISAIISLFPIIFIYEALKEIFEIYPNVTLTDSIFKNAWLSVSFAAGSMFIYMIALMCAHIAAYRIAKNMRKRAINHILNLPLGFFGSVGSGKLRKIINDSAGATETFLAHQLPDLIGAFLTPIAVLVILFIYDWKLGLISLIPVICAVISMALIMGKDQPERLKLYQTSLENMNNEATEYVRGIPVVKTFNQSIFSFEKFHNTILTYQKYVEAYAYRCRSGMVLFQTFLASTPIFLVLSAIFMMTNQTSMSDLFLNFIFYMIFTPICSLMLNKVMWVSQHSMLARDAVVRVENLLNEKTLIQPENPKGLKKFDISIENASFSYPNALKNAVEDVSISIKEGETVALVGTSGGGKSTIATLIPRFWDVNSGSVKIGGIDVKDISEDTLMKNISFVFQNTNLYKASILDNLREGNQNATIEEVKFALKAAMCDDIIEKLPNGLDTVYGTKGVYLSGGEAQRIVLARAILKNAPIILLDEATAFADPENEHQIKLAMSELTKGKTVLMIAHRLSTVKNVDCIYVISDGKVVENGNHTELLAAKGVYFEMWNEYNEVFIWNGSEEKA